MTVAVPAIVKVPAIYTDADFSFDFLFYDFDVSTPHDFVDGDIASLTFVSRDPSVDKIKYLSSDVGSKLSFSAPNVISVRIPQADAGDIFPTSYAYELRRIGIDDEVEVLVIGTWPVLPGLSLDSTMQSPAAWARNFGTSTGANVIFTAAQAQIVYTGGFIAGGSLSLAAVSDPPSPGAGTALLYLGNDGVARIKYPDGSIFEMAP